MYLSSNLRSVIFNWWRLYTHFCEIQYCPPCFSFKWKNLILNMLQSKNNWIFRHKPSELRGLQKLFFLTMFWQDYVPKLEKVLELSISKMFRKRLSSQTIKRSISNNSYNNINIKIYLFFIPILRNYLSQLSPKQD